MAELSDIAEKINELFYQVGYWKAKSENLSPFDKITGGLSWVISAADVDIGIEIEYCDELTLGEKIEVGEAIERALASLSCPHPLQAHQIRGLDYQSLLSVVTWLVEKAFLQRKELAEELAWVQLQSESGEREARELIQRAERKRAEVESQRKVLEEKKAEKEYALQRIKELQDELLEAEKSKKLPEVMELLGDIESLKKEEAELRDSCGAQIAELEAEIADVARQLDMERHVSQAELAERRAELAESHAKAEEEWMSLKKELSGRSKTLALLQRNVSQVLSQEEILQYEKRFSELFEQVQRQQEETRLLFSRHNFLAESLKLTNKEAALLESLHSQLKDAVWTRATQKALIGSMDQTSRAVFEALQKVEAKLETEQKRKTEVERKVSEMVLREREYFSTLKELKDECCKKEAS